MYKNCRFNASETMTLIKRRKRQKFVYCIFRMLKFLVIMTLWQKIMRHSNDAMKF